TSEFYPLSPGESVCLPEMSAGAATVSVGPMTPWPWVGTYSRSARPASDNPAADSYDYLAWFRRGLDLPRTSLSQSYQTTGIPSHRAACPLTPSIRCFHECAP